MTGVNVDRIKFQAYVFSAFCASVASLLILGYSGSAINALGQSYELRVIAATVIGGANLMGGVGHRLRGDHRLGAARGHPKCAAHGGHRLELAGCVRRRLHYSRGPDRDGNPRLQSYRAAPQHCSGPGRTARRPPAGHAGSNQPGRTILKKLLATSVIAFAAMTIGSTAFAQNIFALVPKNMNNPFFDQARDGCKKAEDGVGRQVHLRVHRPRRARRRRRAGADRPGPHRPRRREGHRHLAGQRRRDGGGGRRRPRTPASRVITWDSDLLPENADLRVAYIGTHNYEIGVEPRQARAGDQAGRRHDLHPVRRRRGGQPQRAHAGHPRHARRRHRHHAPGRCR